MKEMPQIEIAGELALAFTYADLHCNLLRRYLDGDLPTIPEIPPFDKEAILLDALADFIGEKATGSLRQTLQTVSLAFEQVAGGGYRSAKECAARLLDASGQLSQARTLLAEFSEQERERCKSKRDWRAKYRNKQPKKPPSGRMAATEIFLR